MAVLCKFEGEGFTKEMYEELRKQINFENNHPKGEIFHAVAFDKSGKFHVVDIWESEEDFNNFVTDKLKPVLEKINAPMPKGEILPIYNANAFQGIDSYKVK